MSQSAFPKPTEAGWASGRLLVLALLTGMGISAFAEGPFQLVAGDLTQDSLSDLVVMDESGRGLILVNQGGGQLSAGKKIYAQGTTPGPMAIADLTGDTVSDLVMLYPAEAGIEAVPGPAIDQNQSLLVSGLGVDASSLAIPGKPPIAAVGLAGVPKIALIQPDAQGTALTVTREIPSTAPVRGLVWADLDGNQADELIALIQGQGTTVLAYQGLPAQGIEIPLAKWEDVQADAIHAGNLNPDGLVDFLLWSSGSEAVALVGIAVGVYEARALPLAESYKKKAGDFNQDGLLDILVISPAQDAVTVYLNSGDLNFKPLPVPDISGRVLDVAFGNFVSPGSLDLVIWTAPHSNGLQPASQATQTPSLPHSLSLYQFTGGTFSKLGEMEIPNLSTDYSVYHNVMIYKKTDVAAGRFYPYRSFFVNDWTIGADAIFGDGSVKIHREVLQNGHLVSAPPVTLTGLQFLPNPAEFEAHVNQFSAEQSLFAFGRPVLPRTVSLTAAPPAGTYNSTITVTPAAPPGATIYYRQNGGGWQTYTPGTTGIILYQSATLDFYATLGADVSPMLTLPYTIDQDPSADSDKDGIPDALEDSFGLPIFSVTKDYDGDGWDDLDELVRDTNPKDKTSVPSDTDQDGWSKFDEGIRQTDPDNPLSFPIAPGLAAGEYLLAVHPAVRLSKDEVPGPVSEGSFLSAWNLFNSQVASATFTAPQWTLRLPGPDPLILRVREKSANTVTISLYSRSYVPCWDPAGLYDGGLTGPEWLSLVRQQAIQQFLTNRAESFTLPAAAATVAFELWLIQYGSLPGPIVWGSGAPVLTHDTLATLRLSYDLDEVYGYLLASLPEVHSWTGLVSQLLNWSRDNPPSQDVDLTLQQLAMGIPVDPSLLPPSWMPETINQAVADLATVLANAPSKVIELTGTLQSANGLTQLVTGGGEAWTLNFGGANIVTGSQVTIRGIRETACSNSGEWIVRVTETLQYQPTLALNNLDSDGDGLPDQWEAFYFGRTDARPHDDPDNDGADNLSEFHAFTHPRDNASKPAGGPTPTPTPVITPSPTVTPVMTPTPPAGGMPKSLPVAQYGFSEGNLAAAGFAEIPGGFLSYPAGESSLGVVPVQAGSPASDGQGLRFVCDPGEVQMIQSLPVTPVGSNPVLVRCMVQATSGGGQFALAAVDGAFDGSAAALIPHDTQFMLNEYKRVALLYDPTTSDTLSVLLQVYNPASAPMPITVYVDNLEIIPLLPGTAIEPNDIMINGGSVNSSPLPLLPKPAPLHVYDFAQATVEAAGFAQVPGGFLPGSTPGLSAISSVPFGWTPPSADGRGVLFTCNPGEIQLIMASPAIGVGQQPVLFRMTARATSTEGIFALAALDGSLDGSIGYAIPVGTAYMTGGFTQAAVLYEPTNTDSAVVVLQLAVPATATGPVSVFVDQIEVIPFTTGTLLEAADLATRPK